MPACLYVHDFTNIDSIMDDRGAQTFAVENGA
jgi:hypothetical protein